MRVPSPLYPVSLYFSSLSLFRTVLHYLNAWNRLPGTWVEAQNKDFGVGSQTNLTRPGLFKRWIALSLSSG